MNTTDTEFTFVNRNTSFENTNEYDLFVDGSAILMNQDEIPFTIGYSEFISAFLGTKRYTIFVAINKNDFKQYHATSEHNAKSMCIQKAIEIARG